MEKPWRTTLASHTFVRQTVADKARGAIVGAALGDCIGLYTEFLNKPMINEAYPDRKFSLTGNVTPFCNDSHRNKFSEGSWTDDTDHSLLILLSFLHSNGDELSSSEFAKRLRQWIEQGLRCLGRLPLGLGRTTASVVIGADYLNDPKAAALRSWKNGSYTAAPNGSLMRAYPLGLMCLDKSLDETFNVAVDFCLTTHADPRTVVSCCIATGIVRGLVRGDIQQETDLDALVEQALTCLDQLGPQYLSQTQSSKETELDVSSKQPPAFDKEELYRHTRAASYSDLELDDLRKQGYVYKCLGSAVFCLRQAMRRTSVHGNEKNLLSKHAIFEEIITELVLEGGDADTNGTVAGAFLGCLLGFSALPPHWYRGVQNIDWLLSKAQALIQTLGIDECAPGYRGSDDPDTLEDGGKGFLSLTELKTREHAFMEMYLKKTIKNKNIKMPESGAGGSWFSKNLKSVFR